MTFRYFKNNPEKAIKEIGNIIYKTKPYVLLSAGRVVLSAGSYKHFLEMAEIYGTYYDHCELKLREYDLHMNDNTKATLPLFI